MKEVNVYFDKQSIYVICDFISLVNGENYSKIVCRKIDYGGTVNVVFEAVSFQSIGYYITKE